MTLKLPISLNKNSPLPLYVQLKDGISRLIYDGQLTPGDPIPSENQLSDAYNISPMTVRQAMSELVNEGLIHRERGRGTFVSHRRMKHELDKMIGFSSDMLARNLIPGSKLLLLQTSPPPRELLEAIPDLTETALTHIKRIRLVNGVAVGIHDSYLHGVDISAEDFTQSESLYQILEAKQIILDTGEETIEAVSCDAETAQHLNIQRGSPILKATRYSWDQSGQFVEFVVARYHPDLYRYTIKLKR